MKRQQRAQAICCFHISKDLRSKAYNIKQQEEIKMTEQDIDMWYLIETASDEYDLDLSERQCIKASSHLIKNLKDDHAMPGNVYYQFLGIIEWYREKQFITNRQHLWLKDKLIEYHSQRDPIKEWF